MAENSIPFNVAVDLCKRYREEHKVLVFSQCFGCVRFSKGNHKKMCFFKPPQVKMANKFVNQLFEEAKKASKL
jgi:hypothetical protein